jgi:hypothetical protein
MSPLVRTTFPLKFHFWIRTTGVPLATKARAELAARASTQIEIDID